VLVGFSQAARPPATNYAEIYLTAKDTGQRLSAAAEVTLVGSLSVVVLNLSGQAKPFSLWLDGKTARTISPAHSIAPILLNNAKRC
jgi:hypothetical protein